MHAREPSLLPDAHGAVAIGRCEAYVGIDQTVIAKVESTTAILKILQFN